MIRTKESPTMTDVTSTNLSKAEAKKLTKKIKEATDHLWYLLIDAHEGKAWKALGYATWEAYVKAEFGMGRAHSYRLLDQGRVIQAIEQATGLSPDGDISEAAARDIKDDLPAVTEAIKAKVDAGGDPEKAVAETIAAKRAEKEQEREARKAEQAENDRRREEHAAALPQAIKDQQKAKADAIAARKAKPVDVEDKVAELERLNAELNDKVEEQAEVIKALETDVTALRTENKLYGEMRVQFEQGGFEKVIAGKDEEIRVLQTRVESESRDKALWANKAKFWKDEAIKLGWKNGDFTVDIETGEIADA